MKLSAQQIGKSVSEFLNPFTINGKAIMVSFELSEAVSKLIAEEEWSWPDDKNDMEKQIRLSMAEQGYVTEELELSEFSAEFDDYCVSCHFYCVGKKEAVNRETLECSVRGAK